jgi:uncharacterized protein YfdQ (DUF2303 family)
MARDPYGNVVQPEPQRIGSIQAAIAAGAALGDPRSPVVDEKAGVFAVVPKEYKVEDLERFLPRPLRIKESVLLHDTDSFIAYVNAFKLAGVSRIFFNTVEEEFVGVLDYHEVETPAWCGHTAAYKPRRSVEFETWMASNRKQMTQVEFARFLEENMPDVVEPNSAELLQVALTFEAKKSVEFSSGVRLNNGQIQFQYDEVVRGTAQKGTIEIPEQFVLGIAIHVNGPAYRIPVRLRWRLQEGKVAFWYEVVRPHRYIEDALKEMRERISVETTTVLLSGSISE